MFGIYSCPLYNKLCWNFSLPNNLLAGCAEIKKALFSLANCFNKSISCEPGKYLLNPIATTCP